MAGPQIRLGTANDADILAHHRCSMFREMGRTNAESLASLFPASKAFFEREIPAKNYVAWVASIGSATVGGGGMQIGAIPPRVTRDGRLLATPRQGLIVNVYVEPDFRRQGIAGDLMEAMIAYARKSDIQILILHASDMGRPLYEKLGFEPTSEMRLFV